MPVIRINQKDYNELFISAKKLIDSNETILNVGVMDSNKATLDVEVKTIQRLYKIVNKIKDASNQN